MIIKKKELQSAVFERLIEHLRERKDVQNIDLMNLAGFCRNCLSKWYREEAEKKGITICRIRKVNKPFKGTKRCTKYRFNESCRFL